MKIDKQEKSLERHNDFAPGAKITGSAEGELTGNFLYKCDF